MLLAKVENIYKEVMLQLLEPLIQEAKFIPLPQLFQLLHIKHTLQQQFLLQLLIKPTHTQQVLLMFQEDQELEEDNHMLLEDNHMLLEDNHIPLEVKHLFLELMELDLTTCTHQEAH